MWTWTIKKPLIKGNNGGGKLSLLRGNTGHSEQPMLSLFGRGGNLCGIMGQVCHKLLYIIINILNGF
jgi:hypothetical protein